MMTKSSKSAQHSMLLLSLVVSFALSNLPATHAFVQQQHKGSLSSTATTRALSATTRANQNIARTRQLFPALAAQQNKNDQYDEDGIDHNSSNAAIHSPSSRRKALSGIKAGLLTALAVSTTTTSLSSKANAYDRTYPVELQEPEMGSAALNGRRKAQSIEIQQQQNEINYQFQPLSAALWGGALWLLSGSRSNPVVTPLANVLYDPEQEPWLQDRNDGLFANIPATLYLALAIVFGAAGAATATFLTWAADGNPSVVLQLAGVSLIGGASLELGRIASGEKGLTRDELARAEQLESEFAEFANNRLLLKGTGNCHRSDVVRAFRRYYAKYRQAESEEYPLGDLEIERLLRDWTRVQQVQVGQPIEMSSAGFYSGIAINTEADVFVQR